MPHDYPLHTDLEVRCLCCQSMQRFRFTSPSDHLVCEHCRSHLGDDKAERRDREHVALWRSITDAEQQSHRDDVEAAALAAAAASATIADLGAQVAQLSKGVLDGSTSTGSALRAGLQDDVVKRAERATELANRRIDRIMAALWRLDAFHHPDQRKPGFCSCGKSAASCGESRILETQRQEMRDWEAKNLRLLRAGQRHGLPDEHPEVVAGR